MTQTAARSPSVLLVHGALIATQVAFGGGSVVGKLGVAKFNPLVFALIREATAGVILLLVALAVDGTQPVRRARDVPVFIACGVFIFANQAFFIVGDKLAGAVIAVADERCYLCRVVGSSPLRLLHSWCLPLEVSDRRRCAVEPGFR